jgi:hypothetical protein
MEQLGGKVLNKTTDNTIALNPQNWIHTNPAEECLVDDNTAQANASYDTTIGMDLMVRNSDRSQHCHQHTGMAGLIHTSQASMTAYGSGH